MRHLFACALLATTATACIEPTQARITRLDPPNYFRSCTVAIGWTADELVAACGTPAIIRDWTDQSWHKCWGYSTIETNANGQGPGGFFVCLRETDLSALRQTGAKNTRNGNAESRPDSDARPQTVWKVAEVFYVKSISAEVVPAK